METLRAIGRFIDSLTQFFKEDNQQFSMGRLLSFYMIYRVIETWHQLSVTKGELQPLDWSQVGMILAAVGVKLIQKPLEATCTQVQKGGNDVQEQ